MRKLHLTVGALCLAASSGCYKFVPVESPRPGMEVRARLKTEAAVRRSAGLDTPIMRLDGKIVEADETSVALDVLVMRTNSVFQEATVRDTVRLETAEIQSVLVRKFSPTQTALVTVGAGLAAFAFVRTIDQITGGTGEDDGGGDPTFTSPVFSLQTFRALLSLMR
jgi:hypothetical protein